MTGICCDFPGEHCLGWKFRSYSVPSCVQGSYSHGQSQNEELLLNYDFYVGTARFLLDLTKWSVFKMLFQYVIILLKLQLL